LKTERERERERERDIIENAKRTEQDSKIYFLSIIKVAISNNK
jgi:hypothetical protein